MLLIVATIILSLLIGFKIYLKLCCGKCTSQRNMIGKTVIITGANSGIGREAALDIAKRGARVILACRDQSKAEETKEYIVSETSNCNVVIQLVDLSLMKSVKSFCDRILTTESRIDVLVCNAGMTPPPGQIHRTVEGLEVQYATNILGHFLMVHFLVDLLKKSQPSRIVVVSSVTHVWAPFNPNNMNSEMHYVDPYFVYCNTKLIGILFAKELNRKLAGTNVTVNALHPGAVYTAIARNGHWYVRYIIVPLMYFYLKTATEGAQTIIHLAVSEDVSNVSGKYFVDCREYWISSKAQNSQLAEYVWRKCEQVLGLSTFRE